MNLNLLSCENTLKILHQFNPTLAYSTYVTYRPPPPSKKFTI